MVIGIDVAHDVTSKSVGKNSIAGFVSSLNQGFTRWHSTTARQLPKQELVTSLRLKFTEALRAYHTVNNCYPSVVVIFRDGIGDSQFEVAAKQECRQLMQSFAEIESGYNPEFGYVVVQKRINVRILSICRQPLRAPINPAPGTVVDHTITKKNIYDFFLVPQKVGQGTVTPVHIVVLKDSHSLSPNVIQNLAYQLTFMYYNWPGAVRVPAPCLYAHKIANLTSEYLNADARPELSTKLYYL